MSTRAEYKASDDRGTDPVTEESRAKKFLATVEDPFNPQASGVTLPGLGRATKVTWTAFNETITRPAAATRMIMMWDPLGDYRSNSPNGAQSRIYLFAMNAANEMVPFNSGSVTPPGIGVETIDLTPFQSPQSAMLTYGLRIKDVTPLVARGGTKTVGAVAACFNAVSNLYTISQSLVRQRDATNGTAVASDQHIEVHHFSEDLTSQIVVKTDAQRGSITRNLTSLQNFAIIPPGQLIPANGTATWNGSGLINTLWTPVITFDLTQFGNATTTAPYRAQINQNSTGQSIDPDSPLFFGLSFDITLPLYGTTALGPTTAGILYYIIVGRSMTTGLTNYLTSGVEDLANEFSVNPNGVRPGSTGSRNSPINVTTGDHFCRLTGSIDAKELGTGFLSSATIWVSYTAAGTTYFNTPSGIFTARAYRQSRGDSMILGELSGSSSGGQQPLFNIEAAVTTNALCGPSLNNLLTSSVELTASRAELNVSSSAAAVITVASAK